MMPADEAELKETNDYLECLFEYANAPIIVWDPLFRITRFNRALEKITGRKAADVLGSPLEFLLPEAGRSDFMTHVRATAGGERWETLELPLYCLDGSVRTFIWNSATIYAQDEETIVATIAQGQDITERKESEELFRLLLNGVKDFAIFMLDPGGRIISWNSGAEGMKSFRAEEMNGRHFSCFYPREDVELGRPDRELAEALVKGQYEGEGWYLRKDGSRFWAEVVINALYDEGGSLRGFALMTRNIAQRKMAQAQAAAEKERLAVTLKSIREGVISTDNQGRIILVNEVGEKLLGLGKDQALDRPLHAVFTIIDEVSRRPLDNSIRQLVEAEEITGPPGQAILIAGDGTEKIIAYHASTLRNEEGANIGMVLVFWNITRQRRREEQLLKMQKLESIGLMATGIAHDFNNILTLITGNIAMAKLCSRPSGRIYHRLTEAERAAALAQDLTRDLMSFSKGEVPVKKIISMADVISQAMSFVLQDPRIICSTSIPPDLWPVEADRAQMSQVINNIVINASQAMPEGGTIQVSAENVRLDRRSTQPLSPGKYVKIAIRDSGIGISKEHLAKIFDPYFTTKKQGNGLGLAITFTIITRHNGYINVESRPGHGTTFFIYLPAAEGQPEAALSQAPAQTSRKKKVLLLEDQTAVREIVSEMLCHLGYDVTTACQGQEVLDAYKKAAAVKKPYAAVILDLNIPGGMDGMECMRQLKEIDPGVHAVLSSGYAGDLSEKYKEYGFAGIITKPHTMESLSRTLHSVIAGS